MTLLSEKLKELNIDKKHLTERLKWFVKYKSLKINHVMALIYTMI